MNITSWDDSTPLGRAINKQIRQVAVRITPHQRAYLNARPKSEGEEEFFFQITRIARDIPVPMREVQLVPERKWRFDFVWPNEKIIVEIEGGTYTGGRHTRGKGFAEDIRKYRAAEKLGYRVIRMTTEMVKNGEALDVIEDLFEGPR